MSDNQEVLRQQILESIQWQISNCPSALAPVYSMQYPNQAIELYCGNLKATQRKTINVQENIASIAQGSGFVRLEWLPSPRITYEIFDVKWISSPSTTFPEGSAKTVEFLNLGEAKLTSHGYVTTACLFPPQLSASGDQLSSPAVDNVKPETRPEVTGHLEEAIVQGQGQDLKYILLHLVNFPEFDGASISNSAKTKAWRGRINLSADGWKITIDKLEEISQEFATALGISGGYALTHVVKLERSDGSTFTSDDVEDLQEPLSYFLSFIRGLWTSLILPVGYSNNGEVIWKEWNAHKLRVDPWQDYRRGMYSRLSDIVIQQFLIEIFPGFMRQWKVWGESLALVIHWYVESNKYVGGIEGSIVLEQAALELLSSIFLLEKKNLTGKSKRDFEKQTAAEKIKQLLSELQIPQGVPPSLTNLVQLIQDKENKLSDSLQAFTWIRNKIVHPSPENRRKLFDSPSPAKVEAWELGLWYLELVLLHFCDYQGIYTNRLLKSRGQVGEELVPWATNVQSP